MWSMPSVGSGRDLSRVVDVQCGRGRDGEKGGGRGGGERWEGGRGKTLAFVTTSNHISIFKLIQNHIFRLIPENPKKFPKILKNPKILKP